MTYLAAEAVQGITPGWDWKPLRRLTVIRREPNADSSSRLLALSSARGVEYRPDDGGHQLPSEATVTGYWRVHPGDLVFNPMWAIGGGVAVSNLSGAVSTAYRVYASSRTIWPRFLHYWMRSQVAIDQYRLLVRGNTTFDRSVTREDLDGMPVPAPSVATQRAIADYLDRETDRINALVAAKQRMVTLLEERLQNFLSDATHARAAIDGASIPDGWTRMPLKRCLSSASYGIGDSTEAAGDYAVLGMGNISSREVVGAPGGFVSAVDHELLLAPGDLLFNRTNSRELVGKVGIVRSLDRPTTFASYLVRLRTNGLASPAYLNYLLNSREILGVARSMALPSIGQANLNPSRYAAVILPLPPIEEQQEIAADLDKLTRDTTDMAHVLEQQILLFQERRQVLIVAAVTGQLKIPEAV